MHPATLPLVKSYGYRQGSWQTFLLRAQALNILKSISWAPSKLQRVPPWKNIHQFLGSIANTMKTFGADAGHYDGNTLSFNPGLQNPHLHGPVHTPDNNRWDTPPVLEGLACWLTLCILEKTICNFTNSVQISFIQTLKLIVFSWTIWWC